jgi:hypothetical protein
MDEIEAFLEECRADPWFQSRPEVVDRLESVLTKFYLAAKASNGRPSGIRFTRSLEGQPTRLSTGVRRSL